MLIDKNDLKPMEESAYLERYASKGKIPAATKVVDNDFAKALSKRIRYLSAKGMKDKALLMSRFYYRAGKAVESIDLLKRRNRDSELSIDPDKHKGGLWRRCDADDAKKISERLEDCTSDKWWPEEVIRLHDETATLEALAIAFYAKEPPMDIDYRFSGNIGGKPMQDADIATIMRHMRLWEFKPFHVRLYYPGDIPVVMQMSPCIPAFSEEQARTILLKRLYEGNAALRKGKPIFLDKNAATGQSYIKGGLDMEQRGGFIVIGLPNPSMLTAVPSHSAVKPEDFFLYPFCRSIEDMVVTNEGNSARHPLFREKRILSASSFWAYCKSETSAAFYAPFQPAGGEWANADLGFAFSALFAAELGLSQSLPMERDPSTKLLCLMPSLHTAEELQEIRKRHLDEYKKDVLDKLEAKARNHRAPCYLSEIPGSISWAFDLYYNKKAAPFRAAGDMLLDANVQKGPNGKWHLYLGKDEIEDLFLPQDYPRDLLPPEKNKILSDMGYGRTFDNNGGFYRFLLGKILPLRDKYGIPGMEMLLTRAYPESTLPNHEIDEQWEWGKRYGYQNSLPDLPPHKIAKNCMRLACERISEGKEISEQWRLMIDKCLARRSDGFFDGWLFEAADDDFIKSLDAMIPDTEEMRKRAKSLASPLPEKPWDMLSADEQRDFAKKRHYLVRTMLFSPSTSFERARKESKELYAYLHEYRDALSSDRTSKEDRAIVVLETYIGYTRLLLEENEELAPVERNLLAFFLSNCHIKGKEFEELRAIAKKHPVTEKEKKLEEEIFSDYLGGAGLIDDLTSSIALMKKPDIEGFSYAKKKKLKENRIKKWENKRLAYIHVAFPDLRKAEEPGKKKSKARLEREKEKPASRKASRLYDLWTNVYFSILEFVWMIKRHRKGIAIFLLFLVLATLAFWKTRPDIAEPIIESISSWFDGIVSKVRNELWPSAKEAFESIKESVSDIF